MDGALVVQRFLWLHLVIFRFPNKGRWCVLGMEHWQSITMELSQIAAIVIDMKVFKVLTHSKANPYISACDSSAIRSWNFIMRMTRTYVSIVHIWIVLAPLAKACKAWISILVSASSWLQFVTEVVELGLWSRLSRAPTVNKFFLKQAGKTTPSRWKHSHAAVAIQSSICMTLS